MSSGEVFGRVSRIAMRSLGLVRRGDAHRCGATDRLLRRWTNDGALERLARDVYRVAASPRTPEQRVLAACLIAGGIASHRTAAALHCFDAFPALRNSRPIDVLVPATSNFRSREFVVHRTDTLSSQDRCRVGVIPATSPVRTLIDLGAVARADDVEEALDSAERNGKVNRHVLEQRLRELRRRGRRGSATIAGILARRASLQGLPDSVLERRLLRLLVRRGLPRPVCQYVVPRVDGRVAVIDFAYPELCLGIEVNGNVAHATPKQRAHDYARANALPTWHLLWFTYEDVMERADYVADAVARHVGSAS